MQVIVRDRVIVEFDGIIVLKEGPYGLFNPPVKLRRDMKQAALLVTLEFMISNNNRAGFDDVSRRTEHFLLVFVVVVYRDIGIGARPEVALVLVFKAVDKFFQTS